MDAGAKNEGSYAGPLGRYQEAGCWGWMLGPETRDTTTTLMPHWLPQHTSPDRVANPVGLGSSMQVAGVLDRTQDNEPGKHKRTLTEMIRILHSCRSARRKHNV